MASRAWLELPVLVDPARRLAGQHRTFGCGSYLYHFAILDPDTDFDVALYPHANAIGRINWRRIGNSNGFGRNTDNN